MARLRIGVEQLGAEGFRLDLEGREGTRNVIALAPGGGIRGTYEQDDMSIRLQGIRADTLVLSEVAWALKSGSLRGFARLHDVEIDAVLATGAARGTRPPFVGTIRAARLEATVDLELGSLRLHGASVEIDGFEVITDERGRTSVELGAARASTIRGNVGAVLLDAHGLALGGPVSLREGVLRVERAACESVAIEIEDLPRGFPPRDAASTKRPRRSAPNLDLLDGLQGHLRLNVTTDVTLPILGRRQATHRFAIPIEDGTVDFRAIEKSLATLENLALDFEVEDDRLVLEKDLPLVPFDNQPLVYWPLEPAGLELARRNRVRLAVLARPQLPPKAKQAADEARKAKGKAVELRRLDLVDVDVDLGLEPPFSLEAGGGTWRFGEPDRPAIGRFRLEGKLAHVPGERPSGELAGSAERVHMAADGVRVGARNLEAHRLCLEAIESFTVRFAGLRPQRVVARLRGLAVDALEARPTHTTPGEVG